MEITSDGNNDDSTEFIKLDLNDEISLDYTENNFQEIIDNNSEKPSIQDDEIFEKPIENDQEDENSVRIKNLRKYNYVFKSKNSSIEDLEKIPAYKRQGVKINDMKSKNEELFSKTILNEENDLELPDVNTYIHDNVD